jgi:peroxidase
LDNAITEEVTNHLLEDLKKPFSGMDLISLNLQRARDHGIAPYNEYRRICNLTKAKTFDDLLSETPKFIVERFKKLYE